MLSNIVTLYPMYFRFSFLAVKVYYSLALAMLPISRLSAIAFSVFIGFSKCDTRTFTCKNVHVLYFRAFSKMKNFTCL